MNFLLKILARHVIINRMKNLKRLLYISISFLFSLLILTGLFACNDNATPPDKTDGPKLQIKSGLVWKDNNGNVIEAHGGQVQKLTYLDHDGKTVTKFWWVGEDKSSMSNYKGRTNNGIHAYSSTDLVNWTDEGLILKTPESLEDMDNEYFSNLYTPDPNYPNSTKENVFNYLKQNGGIVERPKLMYNAFTDKYVLWFHLDNYDGQTGQGYTLASSAVAISDNPWGPFRFIDKYRLYYDAENFRSDESEYGSARDMTVYQENGDGYIVYSSDWNSTLYIGKLDETFTKPVISPDQAVLNEHYTRIYINGGNREAPALFKENGKYYLVTSGCLGWTPTEARVYSADSLFGQWTDHGNPCHGKNADVTFLSQSTCVFNTGYEWVFMADKWNGDENLNISQSTYVWLPVTFKDGIDFKLAWQEAWTPLTAERIYKPYESISVSSSDELKTNFLSTDTFSADGIKIYGNLANERSELLSLSEVVVLEPHFNTSGQKQVTICYGDLSCSYIVNVKPVLEFTPRTPTNASLTLYVTSINTDGEGNISTTGYYKYKNALGAIRQIEFSADYTAWNYHTEFLGTEIILNEEDGTYRQGLSITLDGVEFLATASDWHKAVLNW